MSEQKLIIELIEKDIRGRKINYYLNQFVFGPMSVAWVYFGITNPNALFLIGGICWFCFIMVEQCLVLKHQLIEFNKCLDMVKSGKIKTVKQFQKFVDDQIKKNSES